MRIYEPAIKDFKKSIELYPEHADYYNAAGAALEDSGDLQGAYDLFTQAIKIEGDIPDYYYNRGNVLWKLKKLEEALQDYTEAVRLNSMDQTRKFTKLQYQ